MTTNDPDVVTATDCPDEWVGMAGNDTMTNNGTIGGQWNGANGNDSLVNNGTAGKIEGGAGNDTVVNNASGVTHDDLETSSGDDSIVNYGQIGSDSIISGNPDIEGGNGNDTIENYGTVGRRGEGRIDGNADDDLIINGGTVETDIVGGTGNDRVELVDGAVVNGTIYGGGQSATSPDTGNDTLTFKMTTQVTQDQKNTISTALATNTPSGSVTINNQTYRWSGFDLLIDLINYILQNDNSGTPPTITVQDDSGSTVTLVFINDRRLNAHDLAAPLAVYCQDGGIEVWDIAPDGVGTLAFTVSRDQVMNRETPSGLGNWTNYLDDGQMQVIGPEVADPSKLYFFNFPPQTCIGG